MLERKKFGGIFIIFILVGILLILSSCSRGFSSSRDGCAAVSEESRKDCYLSFAINNSAPDACSEIGDRTRNFCFFEVARVSNDVAVCANIVDDVYWQDACYNLIAEFNSEGAICESIVGDAVRDRCFFTVAVDRESLDLCERIKGDIDGISRELCMYQIAKMTQDPAACLRVSESLNKDICIRKIAKLTSDISLCDTISFIEIRESCRSAVTGALFLNSTSAITGKIE